MKITLLRILNPFFDSSASGNRFASLCKGLQECGARITIVVTKGYNTPEEKIIFDKISTYQGIEIIYLSKQLNHTLFRRRMNIYILSPIINFVTNYKLKKILNLDYDYLWITNNFQILNFFNKNYLKIKRSIIEINEFHDIFKQEGVKNNPMQFALATKTEKSFLEAIKQINYFAIMTKTLERYHQSISNPKGQYLHLPMTVEISRFAIPKSEYCSPPYIAFAGSLVNRKDGLDILIKAFACIHAKLPSYKLKIAGNYHPDVNLQKALITKYEIQDVVEYVGLLSREEIPQFLVDAAVLVLPRPDSHQAQGGFPTKLGEFLATKNPVCVTKVGEIPNYLEDNVSAFLATPGDVDSFVDALTRAISNKEDAERVAMNGYNVAQQHFNISVQAKRFFDFLANN